MAARRVIGAAITLGIFVWIFKPIVQNWSQFAGHVRQISWVRMALASLMFAAFLFVFRALSWRRILIAFGYRLPVGAAVRIWSTSELARYLPGVIWQIVGRAYLVKPYGVGGAVCSSSQVLELVVFLLANVLMALTCFFWNGTKHLHGAARGWMFAAMALAPVLTLILHPRVFLGLMNRILRSMGKPIFERQPGFGVLVRLLAWKSLGLVWQSLAIWIVIAGPLHLQFAKWWIVAGAYSLAWCAGFLAFWAPGGVGVRELVFITAMRFALPKPVREHFLNDPKALLGFLAFLSVLLRIWAISGELIFCGLAYASDIKGALGHDDAPGRLAPVAPTLAAESSSMG